MTATRGTRFRNRLLPLPARLLRYQVSRLLIAVALFCQHVVAIPAASPTSFEYDLKAAFLLNFIRFVEWPSAAFAAPDAPLTVCILGHDPFGRGIDQIVEGESVNGHKITIERIQSDQQRSCQVLYLGNSSPLITSLSTVGPAVLTVGEGDQFIHQGGIIAFVLDSRRVRFDISLKAASNAGLKLSSKLLSVARSVDR